MFSLIGLVAACGGSDDAGTADDVPAPTSTTPGAPPASDDPAPAPTPTTPEATVAASVSSFEDIKTRVIRIVAQGSFRDPEVGVLAGAGSGSGFIISSDGLAVTNNHVVTGAATLEVFVGGDNTSSYNARVLGVSECNDLAVIDINESAPLQALSWYDGAVDPGLSVYAAGFPLGDPEYTLTKGIVSKAKGLGDTGWASIDSTVEHDASIQPGNSGGALVTDDGTVVGVNYAKGSGAGSTDQFFAIGADLAQPVVELLRNGDFESIGVNGSAIVSDDGSLSGIWVAGVAPGTPAANLGIVAGDIITKLNGLPMATDGTMSSYCDVLRTAGEDKPIAVEVLRFDTNEVLAGELRSDGELELSFSLAASVEESVEAPDNQAAEPPPAADGPYADFVTLVDNSGTLTISAPAAWAQVSGEPVTLDDGTVLPFLIAAPDIVAFGDSFETPGMFLTAIPGATDVDGALAQFAPAPGECGEPVIDTYSDQKFTGKFAIYPACGGGATLNVIVAATPADGSYLALLGVQTVTAADVAALDTLFDTFDVAAS